MDPYDAQARLAMYKNAPKKPNLWKRVMILAIVGAPLIAAMIWAWTLLTS